MFVSDAGILLKIYRACSIYNLPICLLRHGLKVKMIDKRARNNNEKYSNANFINARSLELLEESGMSSRLAKEVLLYNNYKANYILVLSVYIH